MAALNFPDAPTNGLTYTGPNGVVWTWDGTKWVASAGAGGSAGVVSFNTRTGAVALVAADITAANGLLRSGGTLTGPLTLAADPAAPLEAATQQYVDANAGLPLSGGTLTGPLTVNSTVTANAVVSNGNIQADGYISAGGGVYAAQVYAARDVASDYVLAGDASTLNFQFQSGWWWQWNRSNGALAWIGSGTGTAAAQFYIDPVGTITTFGTGISYANYSGGHTHAFGWDGSWVTCYVDGGYQYQIISPQWCYSQFLSINTYTPDQVVNYGSNPYFNNPTISNITINGSLGLNFTGVYNSGVWYAFGWDGYALNYAINGGGQGQLLTAGQGDARWKAAGAYTPNQNVDYHSTPTFWDLYVDATLYATNGGATAQFSGWINAAGYTSNSDVRGKQNIAPATVGLKEILQIEPIGFIRIPGIVPDDATMVIHPPEIGFSAQQLRPIIPEAVRVVGMAMPDDGDEPSLGITDAPILAAAVNAIKELAAMNTALTARVETLEARLH